MCSLVRGLFNGDLKGKNSRKQRSRQEVLTIKERFQGGKSLKE